MDSINSNWPGKLLITENCIVKVTKKQHLIFFCVCVLLSIFYKRKYGEGIKLIFISGNTHNFAFVVIMCVWTKRNKIMKLIKFNAIRHLYEFPRLNFRDTWLLENCFASALFHFYLHLSEFFPFVFLSVYIMGKFIHLWTYIPPPKRKVINRKIIFLGYMYKYTNNDNDYQEMNARTTF